jgi:hypothetical protein
MFSPSAWQSTAVFDAASKKWVGPPNILCVADVELPHPNLSDERHLLPNLLHSAVVLYLTLSLCAPAGASMIGKRTTAALM